MATIVPFPSGNYAYIPGGFQYSAAVMADPGYVIETVRFAQPLPLAEGFRRIQAHLAARQRPPTALCACELRSPAPMAESDFILFNRSYVQPLAEWGLFRDDVNPVARCNLIPAAHPPAVPVFHAFSYTLPESAQAAGPRDFITSGAAECPDRPNYRESIVRLGETTPDALAEKIRFAIGDAESRLDAMGVAWSDVTQLNLYTVRNLYPAIEAEFVRLRADGGGIAWHWVRPPVVDLEIEIDARRVSLQRLLPA